MNYPLSPPRSPGHDRQHCSGALVGSHRPRALLFRLAPFSPSSSHFRRLMGREVRRHQVTVPPTTDSSGRLGVPPSRVASCTWFFW